jgi:hypothetical protein
MSTGQKYIHQLVEASDAGYADDGDGSEACIYCGTQIRYKTLFRPRYDEEHKLIPGQLEIRRDHEADCPIQQGREQLGIVLSPELEPLTYEPDDPMRDMLNDFMKRYRHGEIIPEIAEVGKLSGINETIMGNAGDIVEQRIETSMKP